MIQELVKKLQQKNRKAQQVFYENYSKKMFLIILRYINDADVAKNITNQSFYKIFTHIGNFIYSNDNGFNGWVKKIAINEALVYLRSNKNIRLTDEYQEIDNHSPFNPDNELQAQDYYNLIRELPDGYRIIFNMFAIEGYSHKEIAEELNISESTSRSQLTHARAMLRKKIEKFF